MEKIGTITFHSSYNYGSNLQAYALQEYILSKFKGKCTYEIINLRTDMQKQMYKGLFERKSIKNFIKKIMLLNESSNIKLKQKYFEDFIQNQLNITKEYKDLEELTKEEFNFDYYISGSDQVWNLQARDFNWANFLEFANKGKKISYAASFGPSKQNWSDVERERVKRDLLLYDNISVREQGSFDNVKNLTGIEPSIHIDPTMLLTKEQWLEIIPKDRHFKNEKYIFLYNLKGDKQILKIAKEISKRLKLPVVVSRYGAIEEITYGFKKKYNTGPIEFLNLVNNAELVLSSSFHGTVFSILLHKPFFAINGDKDFRINTLLKKMNLEKRSISNNDIEEKTKHALDLDFKEADNLLEKERKKSEEYLKKALDIE